MNVVKFIKTNKVFSTILVLSTFLWITSIGLYYNRNTNSHERLLDLEVARVVEYYENVLKDVNDDITKIEVFTETAQPIHLTQERFDDFVNDQISLNDIYLNYSIAILSDDGTELVQTYVSPLLGNELTLGHDLFADERDYVIDAVDKAILTDIVVVNGPYDLRQGGQGIIFRKAALQDGEFHALVNIAADYDALNDKFEEVNSTIVNISIYSSDEENIFGDLTYEGNLKYYEKIRIDNIDWYIGVNEIPDFHLQYVVNSALIIASAATLYGIAIILGIKFYKKNSKLINNQNYMINYDNLTALPNRRLLAKDIASCISKSNPFFLAFGDLDNFKNLNDILGHSIGDIYLKNVADMFNSVINENLRIYRWGGDEFIFLIKQSTKEDTIKVLDEIYDTFTSPIIINETKYFVSMSMGIVKYPDQGQTLDDLVKKADIVMYDVKDKQKNLYAFFEDKYLDKLLREVDFENKLNSYSLDDFEVYLQPILDSHTNEIKGFEALSRLFDEDNNIINTGELVKYYERSGKIQALDRFTFRKVCEYSLKIKEMFNLDLMLTFNISPLSLSNDLIHSFEEILKETKVNPENLVIEIIETIGFKDINESIILLNRLRDLGFKIAMDDFGIGYSSLSYITRLPLSIIKIDRMFVENYKVNDFDKLLILTIKDISKSLDVEIIVEGIETKEQLEFIRGIECEYYQGYYHSKPMSFKKVIKLLSK